jgi:hypothetical protein
VRPPVEENDWLERAGVRAGFAQEAWVAHYKSQQELRLRRLLVSVWRRGSEGGWWLRERWEFQRAGAGSWRDVRCIRLFAPLGMRSCEVAGAASWSASVSCPRR